MFVCYQEADEEKNINTDIFSYLTIFATDMNDASNPPPLFYLFIFIEMHKYFFPYTPTVYIVMHTSDIILQFACVKCVFSI